MAAANPKLGDWVLYTLPVGPNQGTERLALVIGERQGEPVLAVFVDPQADGSASYRVCPSVVAPPLGSYRPMQPQELQPEDAQPATGCASCLVYQQRLEEIARVYGSASRAHVPGHLVQIAQQEAERRRHLESKDRRKYEYEQWLRDIGAELGVVFPLPWTDDLGYEQPLADRLIEAIRRRTTQAASFLEDQIAEILNGRSKEDSLVERVRLLADSERRHVADCGKYERIIEAVAVPLGVRNCYDDDALANAVRQKTSARLDNVWSGAMRAIMHAVAEHVNVYALIDRVEIGGQMVCEACAEPADKAHTWPECVEAIVARLRSAPPVGATTAASPGAGEQDAVASAERRQ